MPRRTAADAAATRRTILDAARATFAGGGYQAATLDGIAVRAGVTRGAVHHHFGDKHELFVEARAATPTGDPPPRPPHRAPARPW